MKPMFSTTLCKWYASGHSYNITVNESMMVEWDITCRFQSDVLNDAGYVNITLMKDSDILMSGEYTSETTAEFNHSLNITNATDGDYTLEIRSVGSDHTLTGGLNDYYILETVIYYI